MKLYTQFLKEGFFYLLKKLQTLYIALFMVYTAPVETRLSTNETKATVTRQHRDSQKLPLIIAENTHTGNLPSGNQLAF